MTMYLTFDELNKLKEPYLQSPYKCNNGIVLNDIQVRAYNRFTEDLNNERCVKTRNYLKDNRHKYFCFVSGMPGA